MGSDGSALVSLVSSCVSDHLKVTPNSSTTEQVLSSVQERRAELLLEKVKQRQYKITDDFKYFYELLSSNPNLLRRSAFVLITSDDQPMTEAFLDLFEIKGIPARSIFIQAVTADLMTEKTFRLKPFPDPYIYGAGLFGIRTAEELNHRVIGMEDSTFGINALKASGIETIFYFGHDSAFAESQKIQSIHDVDLNNYLIQKFDMAFKTWSVARRPIV